jgi:hypothetical protein
VVVRTEEEPAQRTEVPAVEAKPESLPRAAPAATERPIAEKEEVSKPSRLVEGNRRTEAELLTQLETVPELDLRAVEGGLEDVSYALRYSPGKSECDPGRGLVSYLAKRPDLTGLPLRLGGACRSTHTAARTLGRLSGLVRGFQARRDLVLGELVKSKYSGLDTAEVERTLVAELREHLGREKGETSAGLEQMLQAERPLMRSELVRFLARSKGAKGTAALARRAVFDLSPVIRAEAVRALGTRPPEEARAVLLSALRHPWVPAADHAAEILVTLNDRKAVPALEDLLKQDAPCAPTRDRDGKWVRQELVRVNHLRNCQLCHPPSLSPDDPVRGPVPTPGKPLPVIYYDRDVRGEIVRADITFIKQDFSVLQRVSDPNKWPDMQRFDFFVRSRPLTAIEVEAQEKTVASRPPTSEPAYYPQREAVAWALAELKKNDR